ncbi:MAG: F0F1 ATP synthase subunit B [Bacillota bacterium]
MKKIIGVSVVLGYILAVFGLRLLFRRQTALFTFAFILLSYFILVWLLYHVLYKKIQLILKEREKRIQGTIAEARKKEKDAEDLKEKLQEEQKAFHAKIKEMNEEAQRQCDRMREEQIRQAKEEIQEMRLAAKADIEREKRLAWEEYRQKILSLATLLAQRALRENLTDEDHDRINKTLLDLLEQQKVGDKL